MAPRQNPSQGKPGVDPKHSEYYERNKEVLREKSRQRMAKLRAERRAQAHAQASSNIDQENQDNIDAELDLLSDEFAADDERLNKNISNPDLAGDEDERICLTPFNEIDHFSAASDAVNAWLAEWGGLEAWLGYLDSGYEAAKATGCVDHWIQKVLDHADRGRLLRNLLGQMETALPQEVWKIRELWRQQTVLLGLVIKGLAVIELRVDIIRRGPFNLVQ
ncbi:hypothetical protein BDN72DRAFT_906021 [Pluteus cervinus]|uniref:Uncharacterized protein n=1 Tax=Pluteus cervinus TaxID=181527 RepID=A0ACD3A0U7_9AGAR|nr:hypothetical protein BDN72DRAFT_906021 [Pluteus cervinus]